MLLALLHALAWRVALTLGDQTPFKTTSQIESGLDISTAPFIFNGLSSLLTQWPFDCSGYPAAVYLALSCSRRLSAAAAVPRMARLGCRDVYRNHVASWREDTPNHLPNDAPGKRPLFDGMSAAWGEGWLDSQHMFIFGMSNNGSKDISWWDDYGRAEKLCEWAESRDIEGFVRMNAGFEIIWCDFQSPTLQLVSHLNITPPGTPESTPFPRSPRRDLTPIDLGSYDLEERPPRPGPGDGDGGPPGRGPGRGPGRWPPRMSDLALTGPLEWVRAASHRSFSPQPHLTLLHAGMVTYYHPRLTSLVADRTGRPMGSHRLANISSQDAMSVVKEVDEVLARGAAGSAMDWGTTARDIVEYWGDRISHMQTYLFNASDLRANATAALPAIRTLAYTLLNPYMQPGLTPNASGWDLFFGVPSALVPNALDTNTTALERCTYQATGFLSQLYAPQMTPQESLLQTSIESVLGRLCNDFGIIFAQSSELVETSSDADPYPFIRQWTQSIEDLVQWLDWTVWLRCEDVCPRDYVCSTPMWPIAWKFRRPGERDSGDTDFLKPRCMRMAV